ncbi:hypothetical protein H8R13_17630 [Morganella morganii]|uniref:hypothetical protein n=1 Tax=Morganella morganii TaxID=582 RepID=UPI00164B34DE|nr:hypothetical protein [Morganella morganii]MBC4013546.1 hypothetical protein [Morganella morganii]
MKNPKLIVKPFAKNGQKNVIPENYETSMESNQATWDQGFGQITMLPVAAGGLPPKGQDFNGIFNQISENIVYLSQGGRFKFSAEYAEAIGGYPKGAILQSDDEKKEYLSLIDNNKVDFNTAADISASWKLVNTDDLLAQIASKQPKGDYATKTELNSGLAGKQPTGDYATKTEVNSKLTKDQNGADIPDKPKFIENLGLEAVFAKKSSSDPLTTGTLHIKPFGDVTSCAFHRKDGSYFVIETSADGSVYLVDVNKDGAITGKITFPEGYGALVTKEMTDSYYPLKTELGTAAKKNTGTGAGQIPDMSYFISTKTSSAIVEQLPTGIIRMSGLALVSTDINGNCWVQLPSTFPNKVMFYAGEQNGSNYAGDSSPWLFTPYTNDEAGVTRLSFAVRRSTTGEVMKNDTISMKFVAEGY